MSRRIDIYIGHIVVDSELGVDRKTLAAALERELAAHLRAPGRVGALASRNTASVDGGTIRGDLATSLGRRIGTIVAPGGSRR
jgi:hypothetical protein